MDNQGNIYIASASEGDGQLTVEKFDAGGKPQGKWSAAIGFKNSKAFGVCMTTDANAANTIQLALSYSTADRTMATRLSSFDFAGKKTITSAEQRLDKEYAKKIRGSKTTPVGRYNIQFIENLIPVGIVSTADNIIVVKDIERGYNYAGATGGLIYGTTAISEAAIVSVFDRSLQLKYEPAIDKTFSSYSDIGHGLSYHLKDGKLHILIGEDKGATTFSSYGETDYILDPATGALTKDIIERGKIDKAFATQPDVSLWFPGSLVLAVTYGKHFNNEHRRTIVLKKAY
ncbi:MAG: hypothetical protein JST39_04075 [Bacteroidetes bacterium]|nr:hypothetical protein [Bacteroidota bacterium]